MTKQNWEKHKKDMIFELARLEKLGFSDEANDTIFPHVLIETINILKNSVFVENPVSYTDTGKDANNMLDQILKEDK